MSKILKSTRLKHLPPKIQLSFRDNERLGNCPINRVNKIGQQYIPFNDVNSVNFVAGVINLPSTLPSGNLYLTNESTTNLYTSGSTIDSNVDCLIHLTYLKSSSFEPFVDHANAEADARSPNGKQNSFYATGSDITKIGEGFNQPLWSKTKFEIDITPSAIHSFGISNYLSTSLNNPMVYWNSNSKQFESIGSGIEFSNYITTDFLTTQRFLREQPIGFGSALGKIDAYLTAMASASYTLCNPISVYGFPNTVKFEGKSNNLIPMNRYISEPFLLEKVVLYFSGTLSLNNYFHAADRDICIATFFILNQRKALINQLDQTLSYRLASADPITVTTSSYNLITTRDIVTWLQMSKIPPSSDLTLTNGVSREYDYIAPNSALGYDFSGQFIVSGTMKSPMKYDQANMEYLFVGGLDTSCEWNEKYEVSGRNLIQDRGRSWINPVQGVELFGTANVFSKWVGNYVPFKTNKAYHVYNPYLLFPTDNLIFGWELPRDVVANTRDGNTIYNGLGPQLSINNKGIHKIVFYGSLLRNGKEYHETFEQSLPNDVLSEDLE